MNTELTKLIMDNQNMIYKIAHYFKNYASKEDLFQVGCIGIIKAYNNYKDEFGAKFTTYAYSYIVGEMKKYINDDKGIKISRNINKLNLRIEKCFVLLTQKLMREPTTTELSNYLEIDEYYISEAMKSNNILESLDEPLVKDGKELTLYDSIASIENVDLDTLIALKKELQTLDPDEYQLIKNRYMEDYTQSQTADNLGMSQVQVSRKEQKVLTKLKNKLVA